MMVRPAPFVLAAIALVSCAEKKTSSTGTTTQPSPNASILPAPLESEAPGAVPAHSGMVGIPADSAGRLLVREPEPPAPEAAPTDHPLPEDNLTLKDGAGYSLAAEFRWADVPGPAAVPELSAAAVKEAAAKADFKVAIDLAAVGRMRFALESATFPLPAHTELRAHTRYFGHVLVWPSGTTYRLLAPGSLRAMFAERRGDVTPLLRAKVKAGENGALLGHKTLKSDVETSLGTLLLEQTAVPGSGGGGELLCRLLVELVGAEPTTEACRAERIPLAAHYRWATGGSLAFVVTSLAERKDLPTGYTYVPPAGAAFVAGELPPSSSGVFLTLEDLAKFRTRAVRGNAPAARAPGEGVTGRNETAVLQYLLVDGVPVAWVRPKAQQYVIGPQAGRYSLAWRDFFGTSVTPATQTELPAFVQVGNAEADAGMK